jgi:hypothetical protein
MKLNLQSLIGEIEKADIRITREDFDNILQKIKIITPNKMKNGKLVVKISGNLRIFYYIFN